MRTRTVVTAGAALAACITLTSCGFGGIVGPKEKAEVNYDVTDKVTSLQLRSGSGDVTIRETDRTGIKVTESLYWTSDKPQAEHKVEGETLSVFYDCKKDWGNCGVNYRIEVPKGLNVNVDAGSGTVTLRSLSGAIEANLGSGDIDGSGLTGKKLFAENGSGHIEMKYAAIPDDIQAETGSGDIKIYVPAGSYNVNTDVGSGDATVKVTDDPNSSHKVTLTGGSGDVSVLLG